MALLATAIGLLGFSVFAWFGLAGDAAFELTMTAGTPTKTRHRLALHIMDEAEKKNLELKVVGSAGSVAALDLVEKGEVDIALVQGGIRLAGHQNVRQLAALYIEPLHLLVKDELLAEVTGNLAALRGRSIDMSTPGSGTYLLAEEVLRYAGLRSPQEAGDGDYRPVELSYEDLLSQVGGLNVPPGAQHDEVLRLLPDAVFLVSDVPSQVARQLVTVGGYRLAPIPFAEAFSLVSVDEATADHDRIAQIFIRSTKVPSFAYSVSPPVPGEPCLTLGTRLLVIAHKDVPAEAAQRLCQVIYEGPLQKLYELPTPADLLPEYEPHNGLIGYRDRGKPFIRAELIEYMQNLASVFGPLVGGLLALYGFVRWRQTLRFREYLREICRIQNLAAGRTHEAALPASPTARAPILERRLDELQEQAVDEFSRQYFHGEGVMEISSRCSPTSAFHCIARPINHRLPRRAERERTGRRILLPFRDAYPRAMRVP